jgi:hypothetical protein
MGRYRTGDLLTLLRGGAFGSRDEWNTHRRARAH